MEGITLTGVVNRIAPIYLENVIVNYNALQIIYGGSSSGKSFAIAQRVVLDTLKGRNTLVVRKTSNSLKSSCFNEIVSKISDFNLIPYFKISLSDFTITCTLNRKQILFKGLDDVEKIKSIKPLDGVLTDIWIEEATQASYDDYKLLDKRLRGLSKFKKRITLSFNPILKTHWIYKNFFQGFWQDDKNFMQNDNFSILKTTYRDNNFLTSDDIQRLEGETDPYYRSVYLDGNWGILEDTIYNNWKVQDFDKESFEHYRFGIDWGFADDPFAFIRIALDLKRMQIFVCDEIYQTGLLNDATIPLVRNYTASIGAIVWCDSAEPKSIHEFVVNGVDARGVKKGAGSVAEGINFLKRFEIIIHPSCQNFITEIEQYHYKKDAKTGETIPEVFDKYDHLMDAMRYSVESDMLMSFGFHEIL